MLTSEIQVNAEENRIPLSVQGGPPRPMPLRRASLGSIITPPGVDIKG